MQIYDPFARYYDAELRSFLEDLPLYLELGRRNDGPMLELMCGTGRLLEPLAQVGHRLTGVDSSSGMLAIARRNLAAAELTELVTLIEGDVREVVLPSAHFSLAFVAINSFMHLERVRDQLACLSNVRRALNRRGLLVLDLFNPDPEIVLREDNRLIFEREYELDGCLVQKSVAIDSDAASQISQVLYLYDEINSEGFLTRRTMRFALRWLHRFELEHLLARAGFSVRQIYGSYDLDPFTSASPRLIAIAEPSR